jgi:hypothetical protein
MIDTTIHYKSNGTQRHKMPCLPRPGEYLTHDGRLWRIDAVVHGTPSTTWGKGKIDVYALAVADSLRDDLEQAWATWCEPSTSTDAQQ